MEDSVKQRLKLVLRELHVKESDFCKSLNVSPGFISGMRKSMQPDKIKSIAILYPQINTAWLLTGEGEMLREITEAKPLGTAVSSNDMATELPYIPVAATASFVDTFYDYPDNYTPDTYPVIPRNGEKLSAEEYAVFEVNGESMLPSLRPGSLILTKLIPEREWEYAEGVIVVIYNKSIIVKRVKENRLYKENRLLVTSDNPEHGSLAIERQDIHALYKAKRVISSEIF